MQCSSGMKVEARKKDLSISLRSRRKKDLSISLSSWRTKIISDKLVTCLCDVVKRTVCKRLERFQRLYDSRIKQYELFCMISCLCVIYSHDGCKVIDM